MTIDEVWEESEAGSGYCVECGDLTRSCCEPDAEKYACPDCGALAVYGVEQAVLLGLLVVSEGRP